MKLSASVLLPVCTRYFRNWVRNNEIIVKLQRTCTDCSHASSFNDYLQRSSGVFISEIAEEALWSHFLSSSHCFWCAGQAVILNTVIWDYKPYIKSLLKVLPLSSMSFGWSYLSDILRSSLNHIPPFCLCAVMFLLIFSSVFLFFTCYFCL